LFNFQYVYFEYQLIMKKIALWIAVLFAAHWLSAQRLLTEAEAIELVVERHPLLAATEGTLRQQQLLATARPAWESLQAFHNVTADPDYGLFGTVALGVQQTLPSARVTQASRAVAGSRQGQLQAQKQVDRHAVVRQVRELYHHLSFLEARGRQLQALDSLYSRLGGIAQQRLLTGESTRAEQLLLQDKAQQLRLALETVQHEIQYDYFVLNQLLGLDQPFTPAVSPLPDARFSLADTSLLQRAAMATLANSGLAVAQAEVAVVKAEYAPRVFAGLSGQYVPTGKIYPGWQLGLHVPLFRQHLNTRLQVAELGVATAEAQRQHKLLEMSTELGHLLHAQEKYAIAIDYYHAHAQAIAAELMRSGEQNYRAGEIDYVELIQLMDQAAQIELSHLNDLLGIQLTVIALETLVGQ
jgi:outer membrane protein TolC